MSLLGASLVGLVAPTTPLARPPVAYSAILPELILIGGALALLALASLTKRRAPRGVYAAYTVAVSVAALVASLSLWEKVNHHRPGYLAVAGAISVDGFSVFFLVLVSCALVVSALTSESYLRREDLEGPEFYVLALLSASGAMLMAAANDLIVIFLGLEILSIALYVMTGYHSRRSQSGEAAMKYFILGAFSSALFLYGIALVYGATGSTNLAKIASFLAANVLLSNGVLLAGMALLLVGLGFKVAAVPFHTWTPDVYQGAPTPATAFMAAVAKAGGFAGLLRVFFSSFSVLRSDWEPAVLVIAAITLVVGAVAAVVQRDVKRMLAYSSINHAGFILVGLVAASATGIAGSLYYLFAYAFMVVGSFAVVTAVGRTGDANHTLDAYRGLGRRQPVLALVFTLFLAAQAGIPFTTGFLAKFYVIAAAVGSGSYALAIIAMVSAATAAFFYLRLIVLMYIGAGEGAEVVGSDRVLAVDDQPAVDDGPAVTEPAGTEPAGTEPASTRPASTQPASTQPAVTGGTPSDLGATRGAGVALLAAPQDDFTPGPPRVPVPASLAVALGLCATVTVVFGLYPAPLIDFAHSATLLF